MSSYKELLAELFVISRTINIFIFSHGLLHDASARRACEGLGNRILVEPVGAGAGATEVGRGAVNTLMSNG